MAFRLARRTRTKIRELLQAVGLLAGDSGDEIEVLIDVED
jgi:hypothetical protein